VPKQTDVEMRKTVAKANAILREVSARHGVDIPSMRSCRVRFPHFVMARREFCVLAYAAGIGSVTIAHMLECTPGTVRYHIKPSLRAHKRSYYRSKREELRLAA
jgi:DNA-binding CsgD family transcriptional regulator